jgi:hypothetical protein
MAVRSRGGDDAQLVAGPARDGLEDLSHAGADSPRQLCVLAGFYGVLRLPLLEGGPRGEVGGQTLEPRVELTPDLDRASQAEPERIGNMGVSAVGAHVRA